MYHKGGLGSAMSEVIVENEPFPLERVGVNDLFGRSGDAELLLKRYGLIPEHVAEAAKKAISRKR